MKGKATWDWFGRNFLAAVDGADEREWVCAVDFLAMSRGVCPGVYILDSCCDFTSHFFICLELLYFLAGWKLRKADDLSVPRKAKFDWSLCLGNVRRWRQDERFPAHPGWVGGPDRVVTMATTCFFRVATIATWGCWETGLWPRHVRHQLTVEPVQDARRPMGGDPMLLFYVHGVYPI